MCRADDNSDRDSESDTQCGSDTCLTGDLQRDEHRDRVEYEQRSSGVTVFLDGGAGRGVWRHGWRDACLTGSGTDQSILTGDRISTRDGDLYGNTGSSRLFRDIDHGGGDSESDTECSNDTGFTDDLQRDESEHRVEYEQWCFGGRLFLDGSSEQREWRDGTRLVRHPGSGTHSTDINSHD